MTAPKRRWLAYSLRTMFVVVTVFALWLGWNVNQVRKRERMLRDFGWRGAVIHSAGFHAHLTSGPEKPLPTVLSLLGADPIGLIALPVTAFSEADRQRAEAMFPEAEIKMVKPGGGMGIM